MSQPYRPADLDAALRCETCGAHPDDHGVTLIADTHTQRICWTCPTCDRTVVADIAAERWRAHTDRQAVLELRAILDDPHRFRDELEKIRKAGR